mmetsp:Transcript_140395/g.315154  ORF Transcript_140395/g.315154 Transcript_140395/m.315154 type:complete len:265 (-) Transcript_140395:87-881(-)
MPGQCLMPAQTSLLPASTVTQQAVSKDVLPPEHVLYFPSNRRKMMPVDEHIETQRDAFEDFHDFLVAQQQYQADAPATSRGRSVPLVASLEGVVSGMELSPRLRNPTEPFSARCVKYPSWERGGPQRIPWGPARDTHLVLSGEARKSPRDPLAVSAPRRPELPPDFATPLSARVAVNNLGGPGPGGARKSRRMTRYRGEDGHAMFDPFGGTIFAWDGKKPQPGDRAPGAYEEYLRRRMLLAPYSNKQHLPNLVTTKASEVRASK